MPKSLEEESALPKDLVKVYLGMTKDLNLSYIKGYSFCLAGMHGTGKQLSLDTELPTPSGFTKLADLKVGDKLFDEDGNTCNVTELHPINFSPEAYNVIFDDGSQIEACADHQWLTYTRKDRVNNYAPTVKSTKEILNTLRFANGIRNAANHSIPCARPLNYPKKQLPIDPYVLGCWLGDGNSAGGYIECAEEELLENIRKAGYSINLKKSSVVPNSKSCSYRIGDLVNKADIKNKIGELTYQLKQLNLLSNKHIPDIYLYASYEQRLALLQGLMDTDGCCLNTGLSEYCTILEKFGNQVLQLIRSLGIKARIKKNDTFLYGKKCNDRFRITFTTILPVFRLKRKLANIRIIKKQKSRTTHRFIVDIVPIPSKPMRCITVDSKSHLFLASRSFIPTHNTLTTTNILKKASQKNYTCLYTTISDIVTALTIAPADEKYTAKKELTEVGFLSIDEVDPRFVSTETAADLFGRTFEHILRTRLQNKLPVIMVTNSPNPLETFQGSLKKSLESLMNKITIIPVIGKDYRKNNKEVVSQ